MRAGQRQPRQRLLAWRRCRHRVRPQDRPHRRSVQRPARQTAGGHRPDPRHLCLARWGRSPPMGSCTPTPNCSARMSSAWATAFAAAPALVIGAGVVGMLTALFAQAAGASEVVIANPSPFRRLPAKCLGLTAMTEDQAWNHAKSRWHHGGDDRGADVVFQTRVDSASLHAAMRALRPQGTVIDLAFYQGGADRLRLGEEFHHNGLNLRCADQPRAARARTAMGQAAPGERNCETTCRARRRDPRATDHACRALGRRAELPRPAGRRATRTPADRLQGQRLRPLT
jgi:threonine dehydrogenase-like Zn-dependent dehydrogenase